MDESRRVTESRTDGSVLAESIDPDAGDVIVVRTRDATFRGTLREFVSGSVAVNLAHRQHRPVLVVRLSSVEALDVPTGQPLIYPLKPAPHSTPHGRRYLDPETALAASAALEAHEGT